MGQCQFARRKILHEKLCSLEQDESIGYMIKLITGMLIWKPQDRQHEISTNARNAL